MITTVVNWPKPHLIFNKSVDSTDSVKVVLEAPLMDVSTLQVIKRVYGNSYRLEIKAEKIEVDESAESMIYEGKVEFERGDVESESFHVDAHDGAIFIVYSRKVRSSDSQKEEEVLFGGKQECGKTKLGTIDPEGTIDPDTVADEAPKTTKRNDIDKLSKEILDLAESIINNSYKKGKKDYEYKSPFNYWTDKDYFL